MTKLIELRELRKECKYCELEKQGDGRIISDNNKKERKLFKEHLLKHINDIDSPPKNPKRNNPYELKRK